MNKVPDDEVVEFINITNMCKELGCLPREGGLLDQDSYLVYGMLEVLKAQAERNELERKRQESDAALRRR